ncbi:MAG: hypothetical protein GY941_13255 [Planctomycetes bacterium]|nr:hypothetical protein [Planctomycetota bacterium]
MVLVPKYRHKVYFGQSRKQTEKILRALCRYNGIEIPGHRPSVFKRIA